MGVLPRHRLATSTFTDALAVEALERVVPSAMLACAATDADVPTERRRKLPADVTLRLCVAMSLFTQEALRVVLHQLVHGLRLVWPDPEIALASKSAISQARDRQGPVRWWRSSTACVGPWPPPRRRGLSALDCG